MSDHAVYMHYKLDARYRHVLLDEFQDTNPLQWLTLKSWLEAAAAVEMGPTVFMVGDPKQSIYRFRRADVGIYRDVRARLEGCGARLVHLTTSFRSVPGIQGCVNAAFAPVMTGDAFTLQADYVALSPFRADMKAQPSVVALPVPKPQPPNCRPCSDPSPSRGSTPRSGRTED